MKILHILLLVFLSFNLLFAKQHDADNIALMTKQMVFELDKESIENFLLPYLKGKPHIKHLVITDSLTEENIIEIKKNNSIYKVTTEAVKKEQCKEHKYTFTSDIIFDTEKIGEVSICTSHLNTNIDLTPSEIQWLSNHPKITVHNELNWAPMNFNVDGIPSGFSIDYMNLLAKKIGIEVEYVSGEWNELYQKAINKKIDVMLNIAKTKQRKKFFLFTMPYQKNIGGIFAHKDDTGITNIESLKGKKVAVVEGFYTESLLKNNYPSIELVKAFNTKDALSKVCEKKADATITTYITANYLLGEMMCESVVYKGQFEAQKKSFLHLGIRKDYPLLHSILQKAMADVGANELNELRKKWLSTHSQFTTVTLSAKEQQWINEHPVIHVGGEFDWAPFDFVDENGIYNGVAKEYLDLISSLTGLHFKIHTGKTWSELLEALKGGKIDLLPAMYLNEKRKKFTNFTPPYLSLGEYFFTKKDKLYIKDISKLNGKTISLVKGYDIVSWVKNNYPEITVLEKPNIIECLKSVQMGESYAFIGDRPSTAYNIEKYFVSGIKQNGFLKQRKPISLHMGTKKGYETLAQILTKTIQNISQQEKSKIIKKWMSILDKNTMELSAKEQKWLKNNSLIKMALMDYWECDDNGNNIHTDLIKLINKYGNLNIVPTKYQSWKNGFDDASKGVNIHGIMNLSWSKEREAKYFDYGKGYIFVPHYLVVKKQNQTIKNLDDLIGKKVYVREKTIAVTRLKNYSSKIKIIELKNNTDMLDFLSSKNEADAMVISHIKPKNLDKYNLKVVKTIYDKYNQGHIGVNKKHKELSSIIQKAIRLIPNEKLNEIQNKVYKKTKTVEVILSNKEKEFIKTHPVIKVHNEQNWPPFNFYEFGKPKGFSIDVMNIIAKNIGLNIEYITGPTWDQFLQKMKDKELDVMINIVKNEQRDQYLNFTAPYINALHGIAVRKDNESIKSFKNIIENNNTLALVKGFFYYDYIQKYHPEIKVKLVEDDLQALQALSLGEVDGALGKLPVMDYISKKNSINNLKFFGDNEAKLFKASPLRLATRKDQPELTSILQKGLASITPEQYKDLSKKWLGIENIPKINFTKDEQAWIDKNQIIKYVYDVDWAPFEWKNELDEHIGIIKDVLSIIEERSGLLFEPVDADNWNEAMSLVKTGGADMHSAIGEFPEGKNYLNFTKNHIFKTPYVFVTRSTDNNDYLNTFAVISNKKVGVVDGYEIQGILKEKKPNIPLVSVNNFEEGFKKVQNGELDIMVVNGFAAKYFINRRGFEDLKIATKIEFNLDVKIALQKNTAPEALSIIDKVIGSMSEKELSDIYFKWTEVVVEEKIDWTLVFQIAGVGLLIISFVLYNNRRLASLVDKKTKDIQDQKIELENLIEKFDHNVIFSRTDLNGIITHASDAFCEISGYSYDELVGQPHNIVRHPDMPSELFRSLWDDLKQKKSVCIEIKNKKKNGDFYWVESSFEPDYDKDGNHIGYSAIRVEITNKKAVEELSRSLEEKVIERTSELNNERNYITSIMNAQENLVVTTDGVKICNANHSFFHFFQIEDIEEFLQKYGNCICDTFDTDNPEEYIQKFHKGKKWVDYIYETPGEIHEVKITVHGKTQIFSVSVDKFFHNDHALDVAVFTNITELEEVRKEIEEIHERTKESIEYASLIQHSLIPEDSSFKKHFSDYMTIWQPKDVVGGDIYLFDELRNEDESLLMVIDCTGHGVHGAFVTMMVRAIERQIVSKITYDQTIDVSPAWILSYFNTQMKKLLKQESNDSISNAGFDGAIFYFNQKEKYIKYAGASIPLFYTNNGEIKKIKCDRHSIGYKQSDNNFEFHDHMIEVENGMVFYMTSDGYLDQNGGTKGFPFGTTRLLNILREHHDKSLSEQKEVLLEALNDYQGAEERNDDITLIALKI